MNFLPAKENFAKLSVVGLLLLAACSSAPSPTTSTAEPPESSENATEQPEAADTTAAEAPEASAESAEAEQGTLANLVLTNANTGEQFTLADFKGKTIAIEPMSVTCSSCKKQHENTVQAYGQLKESGDFVFVSLSIDNGLSDAELKQFAEDKGYEWVFAVATPEMTSALQEKFGQAAFSTGNTPQFTIAPDGTISELATGFKEPDVLVSKLQESIAQ